MYTLSPPDISAKFGTLWCEGALYYNHPSSLRFELSIPSGVGKIAMFLSAHERAMRVLRFAFADASDLHLAVQIWHDAISPGFIELRNVSRSLQKCELPGPVREGMHTWLKLNETDYWQTIMVMPLPLEHLNRAIWAAVAHDLGIRPRIEACIYLLSMELGILAHPYDDRGMDIIGPNKDRLKRIYEAHRDMLLTHNIEEMDAAFGSEGAQAAGSTTEVA